MKEIHIVWNKVTAHSRFWALVLFLGVLPAVFFYIGVHVERLSNEQNRLTNLSEQTLFKSQHGMCRLSDCSIQGATTLDPVIAPVSTSTVANPVINVISPKQGEKLSTKAAIKVAWTITPKTASTTLSVLLLDSTGHAATKPVIVKASRGSINLALPSKISKLPYTVLIQTTSMSTRGDAPFAYSGDFYL